MLPREALPKQAEPPFLLWGDHVLSGLRNEDKSSFLDKINSVHACCHRGRYTLYYVEEGK